MNERQKQTVELAQRIAEKHGTTHLLALGLASAVTLGRMSLVDAEMEAARWSIVSKKPKEPK